MVNVLGIFDPTPWSLLLKKAYVIQGIPSETGKSNLAMREGRKDISDILWHFFSRKHMPILTSELVFIKNKWEIMKNHNNC